MMSTAFPDVCMDVALKALLPLILAAGFAWLCRRRSAAAKDEIVVG